MFREFTSSGTGTCVTKRIGFVGFAASTLPAQSTAATKARRIPQFYLTGPGQRPCAFLRRVYGVLHASMNRPAAATIAALLASCGATTGDDGGVDAGHTTTAEAGQPALATRLEAESGAAADAGSI